MGSDVAPPIEALWEAPIGLALFDLDLRYVRVNAALAALDGVPAAEHVGRTVLEILPDQHPTVAEQLRRVRDTGLPLDAELAGYGPRDASVLRHWRLTCFPVHEAGALRGVGAMVVDVSEQRRAERLARSERDFLTAILDTTGTLILVLDREGTIVRFNKACERLTGYSAAEVQGRTVFETFISPAELPGVRETFQQLRGGDFPRAYRNCWRTRDGRLRLIEWDNTCIADERGGVEFVIATGTDITERSRAEEAVHAAEQRLRTVVQELPSGLIVADLETRDFQWNREALAIHGYTGDDDVHRFLERLIADHELHALDGRAIPVEAWPLPRLLAGDAFRDYELRVRNVRLGWERVFSYSGVVLHAPHGGARVGLLAIQDVTARKRAEQELRELNDRLREVDRRKDEFLGMLSHELRNPLAPVRNSLHILGHPEASEDQVRRAKEVAGRQLSHLTRLVDDLLDVTRIARGKIELHRAALDLVALLHRSADDHRPLLQARGIDLRLEDAASPVIVNGDETRLAQVLGNLLHNALKFTPAGGRVTLSLSVEAGRAIVRVRDTGAGIAPELLGTIFEPFTQVPQTLARSEGGLGLGLALVKGLVSLHGGEVAAHSAGPGRGTELVLALPLDRRRAVRPRAPGEAPAQAAHLNVLVVDDNRDAAESLAELLMLDGHEVAVAHDGPTALALADAERPDVILCDIGLPGMDGYEVARRLRSSESRHARLVAVSGYAQPDDVARAAEAGFDAHVAKPPDPQKLSLLLG